MGKKKKKKGINIDEIQKALKSGFFENTENQFTVNKVDCCNNTNTENTSGFETAETEVIEIDDPLKLYGDGIKTTPYSGTDRFGSKQFGCNNSTNDMVIYRIKLELCNGTAFQTIHALNSETMYRILYTVIEYPGDEALDTLSLPKATYDIKKYAMSLPIKLYESPDTAMEIYAEKYTIKGGIDINALDKRRILIAMRVDVQNSILDTLESIYDYEENIRQLKRNKELEDDTFSTMNKDVLRYITNIKCNNINIPCITYAIFDSRAINEVYVIGDILTHGY